MDDLIQHMERVERKTDVLLKRSSTGKIGLLTPDELAEILNISRLDLMDLIEDGRVDFVGRGMIEGFTFEQLQDFIEEYDSPQYNEKGGPEDD